jgi:hypothetical protein
VRQHQRDPKAQGRGEGEDNGGPGHWDILVMLIDLRKVAGRAEQGGLRQFSCGMV